MKSGTTTDGRKPRDRVPYLGSAVIHFGAILLLFATNLLEPTPLEFVTFEIELFAPPPVEDPEPEPAAPEEELVVDTPDQPPPEPEELSSIVEEDPPPPEEEPPDPTPDPPPAEAEPNDPAPDETESSGADINVRMEGLRQDYPEYWNTITRQIRRCLRWSGVGTWETKVYFVIGRDGIAFDLDIWERSGNTAHDLEAVAAVECAGRGRFGPLPEDLPYDQLPVLFSIRSLGFLLTSPAPEKANWP